MAKSKVFMIMPFEDFFFEVYEMIKRQFSSLFEFSNAGEEANQQNILKDIIQPIYEADVVIADLTGLNPNVMYELGLAHSFNKKTIIITQDELTALPFDLKQYRAMDYSTHFKRFAELIDYLNTNLNGAVDDTVVYSNPVKDFLDSEDVSDIGWFSRKELVEISDESDKGFIDFLADIESNTAELTENINEMVQDMQEMSEGVSKSTEEIERVNQNGGNSTATFVRKETKKIAGCVEEFSLKLREHNKNMFALWDEIEKNTLGLLESPISSRTENQDGLIKYLQSLYDMKESASGSANSIAGLKATMQSSNGIERSMNQAIRFVTEDINDYIVFVDRLCVSIDKILAKARFVVGKLDYENMD